MMDSYTLGAAARGSCTTLHLRILIRFVVSHGEALSAAPQSKGKDRFEPAHYAGPRQNLAASSRVTMAVF